MRDERTDEELIAAANAGDAAGFEALYERYHVWVFGVAMRFTGDRDAASDVVQETFMYFLRKFPGFTLTAKLKTFLYPVIRHNALASRRRGRIQASRPESLDRAISLASLRASPGTTAEQQTNFESLRRAMDSLEPGHREVVILRFAESLDLQEIAVAMALPLGTVKSRLHNALVRLRADPALREFFESA